MNINSEILERLKENIFERPYASDGKNSQGVFVPCRKMAKDTALTKAVIQFNGPRRLAYILIDIDYECAALAWQDHNCPPPNLIIVNPENGHAHYVYELSNPVWRRQKDDHRVLEAKPVWFYGAVTKALTKALHGDPGYSGLLGKNPFHPNWRVFSARIEPYSLTELSSHLDLPDSTIPEPVIQEDDGHSRVWDCILFNSISKWARRAKSNYDNYEEFKSDIADQLTKLNSTSDCPLKVHELSGMCRRIAKWTWDVYRGSGLEWKPSLGLSPDEIRERQSLAGKHTCKFRKETTLTKIKLSVETLYRSGSKISKVAISRLSGLSRRTVYSFSNQITLLIDSLLTEGETVSPQGTSNQAAPTGPVTGNPNKHRSALHTTAPVSFADIVEQQSGIGVVPRIKAIGRAKELARCGILVSGIPETLKSLFAEILDTWREQRNLYERAIE